MGRAKPKLVSRAELARLAGIARSSMTEACQPGHGLHPAVDPNTNKVDMNHPVVKKWLAKRTRDAAPPPAIGVDSAWDEAVAWCHANDCWAAARLAKGIGISRGRATKIIRAAKALGADLVAPPAGGAASSPAPVSLARTERRTANGTTVYERPEDAGTIPDNIAKFADMTIREAVYKYGTVGALVDVVKAVKAIEDVREKQLKNAEREGELVSRELVKRGILQPIDGVFATLLQSGSKSIALEAHTMALAGDSPGDIETTIQKKISQIITPAKQKLSGALDAG